METFDYVSGFDAGFDDTGSIFGSIAHAVGSVARAVTHPARTVSQAAHTVGHAVTHPLAAARDVYHTADDALGTIRSVAGVLTNNPIWDIATSGASFIPGIGTAVSSGMAGAAAIGRNASLADIGLAAARGAIPGGPLVQAGFDVALGAIRGHNLTPTLLHAVRAQLPAIGGDAIKGAFDAAVAIEKKLPPMARDAIRSRLSAEARKVFDATISGRPKPVPAARPAAVRSARTSVTRVPRIVNPPNVARPFPSLSAGTNKVAAAMLASPQLRRMPPIIVTQHVGGPDVRDTRSAIAAFLQRFSKQRVFDWRDVGEYESLDQAASRHQVDVGDLGEWPTWETGALEVMKLPPIGLPRRMVHALYQRGDDATKKAILAHGFLAHHARNTGELDGTTWTIRQNDWPYTVAEKVSGSGGRYLEIAAVNPGMRVITDSKGNKNLSPWKVGQRVQLPPSWLATLVPVPGSPSPAVIGGPPFPAPSQYPSGYPSSAYLVKDGDTGEKIAALITGDKNRWPELLSSNPQKKRDPKFGIAVYPGERLTLPKQWTAPVAAPVTVVTTQPGQIPAPAAAPPPPPPPAVSPPPSAGGVVNPVPVYAVPPAPIGAIPPSATQPVQSQPAVIGTQEQIATLQLMLGAFFRSHPEAAYTGGGGRFGASPEDLAGVWTPRTQLALSSFQKWYNANGYAPGQLQTDGLPDAATLAALERVTQNDVGPAAAGPVVASSPGPTTAPAPAAKKDSFPILALAALPFLFG